MSYFVHHEIVPSIAVFSASFSGNTSAGSEMTFCEESGQTFNNINNLTIGSTSLTLGQGHWFLRGYLGVWNNSSLSNYADYAWYLNGAKKGNEGNSAQDLKVGADPAQLEVSLTGSTEAKLKISAQGGTTQISGSYCSIVILKV